MTVHRMVESKMKKQCEEKEFGYLRTSTYIRSCTENIQAYAFDFVYKFCHVFNLLSIVYKCTDASPKHSTLFVGAKNDKKICADHEYLQPLIILIHTRTYSYILSNNTVYFESGWIRLAMTYCRCCTLVPCIAHSILPFCGLFDGQASQAGLAAPKLPQPRVDLIDIAAPPSVRCSSVGTAIREARILALAEYVRDCWSRVTSQKQWHKRSSAHHILDIGYIEAGGWGWFIQVDHSSILHRPLNRQFELFKGTEENQGVYYVIGACFVGSVFRQSSIIWSSNAREEKMGTGIPAVL